MYTLVTLADVVQIPPSDFSKPSMRSIEDYINAKYADKVIHKVGLCVGFHSLISASEGLIGHGTGIVNVNVDFRLVVFRPFKGEIVRATITKADVTGITLSADFFEDIHVPPSTMFEGTTWQEDTEGQMAYVWKTDDGEGGENEFFFDIAETCLVRVEEEQWTDISPDALRNANDDEDDSAKRTAPYVILGSMMHAGLGPTLWWAGEPPAEDDNPTNGT